MQVNKNMYATNFEPVVSIGQNYAVLTVSGMWRYYECLYVEPLPASLDLVEDFSSVSASSVSRANEVSILAMEGSAKVEVDVSEVAQIRFYPIDDVAITVKQPNAMGRFKTLSSEIRVDYNTRETDPALKSTEIYIYEDSVVYFDIYNLTQYDMAKTRVAFFGWRIVGRLLKDKPEKLTYLAAAGYVS